MKTTVIFLNLLSVIQTFDRSLQKRIYLCKQLNFHFLKFLSFIRLFKNKKNCNGFAKL